MKDQYQSKSSKLAYRKHLDAIRGLACVAVVLFHCKVPFMVNGWIGVDMFFVLSGFLITSILLRELLESDRLNFRRFYCRRFVRLFPASATVLGITAVLFRYTEMPQYVRMHKQSFVASALYFQNWHGLSIALDYFTDEGSDHSLVSFDRGTILRGLPSFSIGYFFRVQKKNDSYAFIFSILRGNFYRRECLFSFSITNDFLLFHLGSTISIQLGFCYITFVANYQRQ